MWETLKPSQTFENQFKKRTILLVEREFQTKYLIIFTLNCFLGIVLFLSPVFFYVNENYSIFLDQAYSLAPTIIDNLEKEQLWVNGILISCILGFVIFISILTLKATSNIVGPIYALKRHMEHLTKGKWNKGNLKVRDTDEFKDFIDSYNFLYKKLVKDSEQDLLALQSLDIDNLDPISKQTIQQIIAKKKNQLGYADLKVLNVSSDAEAPNSRHAS
jgi:hypothetical protein